MNSLKYISILSLTLFLLSCKTTRPAVRTIVERTDSEIYSTIYNHNCEFNWFVAEGNLKVDSPMENVSAKIYLRMRADSIIWSVVKKVGVEGGRLLATPKSYAVLNRIDGTYSRGSTSSAFANLGIELDFTDIQQALVGNIMLPDTSTSTISKLDGIYTVHYPKSVHNTNATKYMIDGQTLTIQQIALTTDQQQSLEVLFSEYKASQTGEMIPHKRIINITDEEVTSTIILDFKKISINVPKSTKFSIPRHYEELESIY